jgi:hypothetical protein
VPSYFDKKILVAVVGLPTTANPTDWSSLEAPDNVEEVFAEKGKPDTLIPVEPVPLFVIKILKFTVTELPIFV